MSIRTSKRSVTATVAGLGALLVLVACATPATPTPDGASDTTLLPAAEGTTRYPLTLSSAWGTSVLEERPERVLAIDIADAELVASLSATPVAVLQSVDSFGMGYITDAYPGEVPETLPEAGDWPSVPLEAIAAVEPDLIVVTERPLDDTYAALSQIAPVLAAQSTDLERLDWRSSIDSLGASLDLASAAERVVSENERLYDDAAAAHPEFAGKTISTLGYWAEDGTFGNLALAGSSTEALFLELGFAPHPAAGAVDDLGQISPENIALFDADVMFLGLMGGTPEGLDGAPLFQGLSVVQNDRVLIYSATSADDETQSMLGNVPIEYDIARAIQFSGPISERYAVETLLGPLAELMSR